MGTTTTTGINTGGEDRVLATAQQIVNSLNNTPKLKSLPDFLPTTPLKKLEISFSPILEECCQTEIGDQWPKISHIPNILIDGTYVRRDGRPMKTSISVRLGLCKSHPFR